MKHDLDYPWDFDDLFLKTRKYLKGTINNKKSSQYVVKLFGGYTSNILQNWTTIFANHYNIPIKIKNSGWGAAFSQLNIDEVSDFYICLNSSHDILSSVDKNNKLINIKQVKQTYYNFILDAKKSGKFIIATSFDNSSVSLPSIKTQNEYQFICHELNFYLTKLAKKFDNFILISLESLCGLSNKNLYSSLRDWYNFGQYLNVEGSILLAHKISRSLCSILNVSKKVLLVDLDNTIWGGVIGDDGFNNIKIGQETNEGRIYEDIQKYILQLKKRGVILGIVSKNTEKIAKQGFNNLYSILKWKDFVIKKINWERKSKNIIEISKSLNLGLDSFVFIDDNPSEREEVKSSLPMITIPNCGEKPEDFITALNLLDPFNSSISVTNEDKNRNKSYIKDINRRKLEVLSINQKSFLQSLKIKVKLSFFNELNIKRIHQLNNKTNQFNFTGIRLTEEEILKKIYNRDYYVICANVSDKFGNYGITCLIYLKKEMDTILIENWIMSCRVFGKTIEIAILLEILKWLHEKKIDKIKGIYIPTTKNTVIQNLYKSLYFKKEKTDQLNQNKIIYIFNNNLKSNLDKINHYCEIKNELNNP